MCGRIFDLSHRWEQFPTRAWCGHETLSTPAVAALRTQLKINALPTAVQLPVHRSAWPGRVDLLKNVIYGSFAHLSAVCISASTVRAEHRENPPACG